MPPAQTTTSPGAQRGDRVLKLVTRFATVEDFLDAVAPLIDEGSLFIVTRKPFPIGPRRFRLQLQTHETMVEGQGEIRDEPGFLAGPRSPMGVRLYFLTLSDESTAMHLRLLQRKRARQQAQPPPVPTLAPPLPPLPAPPVLPLSATSATSATSAEAPAEAAPAQAPPAEASLSLAPPATEPDEPEPLTDVNMMPRGLAATRRAATGDASREAAAAGAGRLATGAEVGREQAVPGSSYMLPANPFGELSERTLEEFIECMIYEDQVGAPEPDDEAGSRTPIPEPLAASRSERMRTPIPEPMGRLASEPVARLASEPVTTPAPTMLAPVATPVPFVVENPPAQVRVTLGIGTQALTAVLAAGIGLLAGYVVFGLRQAPATATVAAKGVPSVASTGGEDASAPELAVVAEPAIDAGRAAPVASPIDAGARVAERVAEAALDAAPEIAAEVGDAGAGATAAVDGCRASITTVPPGARVLVDGRVVGPSPVASLAVACGKEIVVAVEHPRYRRVERRVTATVAGPATVDVRLQRPEGQLTLISSPPGAVVTVDGKVVGRSPAKANVTAFTAVYVTVSMSGYKVWVREVMVAGRDHTVRARLEPIPGAK